MINIFNKKRSTKAQAQETQSVKFYQVIEYNGVYEKVLADCSTEEGADGLVEMLKNQHHDAVRNGNRDLKMYYTNINYRYF